jgi:hypothetical protein
MYNRTVLRTIYCLNLTLMQKFLVLYLAPSSVLEEWSKTDPATRKVTEEKMQGEWRTWVKEHEQMLHGSTAGVGKTRRVTSQGTEDTKNNIMLYSTVEAESPEAATALFAHHPHLQIPEASIEIMPISPLSGMA